MLNFVHRFAYSRRPFKRWKGHLELAPSLFHFFRRKATYITSDKEGEGGEERRGGAGGGGGEGEGDLWCRAATPSLFATAATLLSAISSKEGHAIIWDIMNRGLKPEAYFQLISLKLE